MPLSAETGGRRNAKEQAQYRWDHVAKPLHSLGKLEDAIVQIAGIQQTADVCIDKRCALVFCADHGVVAEGVAQSSSQVTAIVAGSIAEGTANINLMASVSKTDVFAVDMGMLAPVKGTLNRRIAAGTQNMTCMPAMTRMQAEAALQAGMEVFLLTPCLIRRGVTELGQFPQGGFEALTEFLLKKL